MRRFTTAEREGLRIAEAATTLVALGSMFPSESIAVAREELERALKEDVSLIECERTVLVAIITYLDQCKG